METDVWITSKKMKNTTMPEEHAKQFRQGSQDTIKDFITKLEGTERLLYSDPSNPYESIYIEAKIRDGMVTVTDSECEHGLDSGWSHEILAFDKINTEKAISILLERNNDPFEVLQMV